MIIISNCQIGNRFLQLKKALSPKLFIYVLEDAFREIDWIRGLTICRKYFSNLRRYPGQ